MGKVSPKDRGLSTPRRKKRRLRSPSNDSLRARGVAKLRHNKASAAKSCTDLGKKRVAVVDADKMDCDVVYQSNDFDQSPLMLSPVDFGKQDCLLRTPRTPEVGGFDSESRLEALPLDLVVKILCHLHHDQLRAVFHVSKRIRKAALLAWQFYFNYTTPDRSRQEMLRLMTPRPTEHWPFLERDEGKGVLISTPETPKAPRHSPRPPRVKFTEMSQIAAVLFQESSFPPRCVVPSVLSKPLCKSLASNRALFGEDELCHAINQNKLG